MRPKPVHAPMDQFPFINGELHIGGIPVSRLAARAGQTPFYAYDRKLITDRVQHLRAALPEGIHIHYAVKANPMTAVVQHLANIVDGFDLASAGEMETALDTTMPAEKVSIAGPGKTDKELQQAVAAGITINLESENEMIRLHEVGETLGIKPRVAIRVNPDFELKSSGMTMGGGAKPFGIDAERVPAAMQTLSTLSLDFHGLHIFWGSQNLNPESIKEAHEKTFDLAIRLGEHAPAAVRSLNIGGGLGIPYFPGDKRLDLQPIGENLDQLLTRLKQHLPEAEVITELGRYIVGEAGVYICRITDIKESRGEKFLVTDGGLHHHLAASGNFGQVIRKNYPVAIANKESSTDKEIVNIVGPLCTPLDILAIKIEIASAECGDLIAVYQSGAYGYSASPSEFLGHPDAVELLI